MPKSMAHQKTTMYKFFRTGTFLEWIGVTAILLGVIYNLVRVGFTLCCSSDWPAMANILIRAAIINTAVATIVSRIKVNELIAYFITAAAFAAIGSLIWGTVFFITRSLGYVVEAEYIAYIATLGAFIAAVGQRLKA
jgi:lysylphosphatidylglycerol synthetase-like protein (DUF2156 family)